jgi:hypothetical protein
MPIHVADELFFYQHFKVKEMNDRFVWKIRLRKCSSSCQPCAFCPYKNNYNQQS